MSFRKYLNILVVGISLKELQSRKHLQIVCLWVCVMSTVTCPIEQEGKAIVIVDT